MTHCRLHPAPAPADADLVRALQELPTAVISDQMGRDGALRGIRPLAGTTLEPRLAGPALTVRTRPGDNLVLYKAITLARPGDVLVIDAGGGDERAVMGEIVYRLAVSRRIAGAAIFGAVRDAHDIGAGPVPVFATGVTHLGPHRSGPGEVRGPLGIAGTVVRAGDLVVGDSDGLVVVPARRADEVARGGHAQLEQEERSLAAAARGELDLSWLDDALTVEDVDAG